MEPLVELRDVRRSYPAGSGEVAAVRGVSFQLWPGDFAALVGPSGCGKSTLLNLIGCLDRPTSGQILLEGVDVSTLDEDRLAAVRNRRLGFVFQNYNLLPRMSAVRNVELPMVYAGLPPAERRRRALEGLDRVGLLGRQDHTPAQLSGGESQRVAVARALAMDPGLILADEPTGNLDSRTGAEIMELFHSLNAEGKTFLMVTHSPEMAEQARTILRMRDGRLVAESP